MQREKGTLMASDGEHTASRRRSRGMTGSYNPDTSVYQKQMSRADTSTSPHTDGYRFDEGMIDPPRPSSSVVRLNPTTNIPRHTSTQPVPSPIPQRRQGTTREFSGQQAQSMRQTRQPRLTGTGQQSGLTGKQPRLTGQQPATSYTSYSQSYKQPKPRNQTAGRPPEKEPHRRRVHWLLPAGVGMIAMLVLWIVGSNVLAWGTQRYNDFTYGNPRTYQTDAVVGHNNDSPQHESHFIALNWHHQAVITEMMAGDPSKIMVYKANFLTPTNDDYLAPVTLEFKDVTGDKLPDMIVHIQIQNPGQNQVVVFVNTGKQFRPLQSNDKLINNF